MKFCMENDIVYLDNSNICLENLERGGTWGGLHLNDSGTELFKRNILDILEVWYKKAYARALCAHNDKTPIELDTTQDESSTTQKASDEDSSLNTDNDNTSFDSNENAFDLIKQNRLKNKDKVILAHLNINSIRNKFTCLKELVSDNIDVLVIQETKLDETFPERAFMIPGYKKPFRKDRNSHGGGIMVFIRDDIPSREVPQIQGFSDLEGMFVEINLRKSKWLLFATYKPPSFSKDKYFSFILKRRR